MAEFTDAINIEAPPHVVFDFLTTEAGLTSWMGQYAHLEPHPGGEFSVSRGPPGSWSLPARRTVLAGGRLLGFRGQ